jgi:hypothetical protein
MSITWKQINKYYLATDGYTISKSLVYGVWIYQLWQGNKFLGKSQDVKELKQLHLDAIKNKPTLSASENKYHRKY